MAARRTAPSSRKARAIRLVLVGGTPGVKTPRALSKLIDWIRAARGAEAARWKLAPKLEDLLIERHNRDNPHLRIGNLTPLLDEPKPILRRHWAKCLDLLRARVDELADQGAEIVLVPLHFVWYHQRLREYVSTFDPVFLRELMAPHEVTDVLCLIDDIHDVYSRLRQPGALYDKLVSRLSAERARRGHALIRHLRILDWRAAEISACEATASQLGSRFTVLATKHQPSIAFNLLQGASTVYLSHSITEIRRLEATGETPHVNKAASFKECLWQLQQALAEDYAVFLPTCIDEYRLSEKNGRIALSPRFYELAKYDASLFSAAGLLGDDVIYDDLPAAGSISDQEMEIARDLSSTVREFIENQVTARDLQLVTQAGVLVVFRPRFNGTLSGGVQEEIGYFDLLTDSLVEDYFEVVFLDSAEDERDFLPRQFAEAMLAASANRQWSLALRESPVILVAAMSEATRERIRCIMADGGGGQLIRDAINSVLRDLGRSAEAEQWHIATSGEPVPLGREHTYVTEQDTAEAFFDGFRMKLTPFEGRHPYRDRRTLMIDGRSSEQLKAELDSIVSRATARSEAKRKPRTTH